MISQIGTKFSGNNTSLMKGLAIIPKIVIETVNKRALLPWKDEFKQFLTFYAGDLPLFNNLEIELDMWESHCKIQSESALAKDLTTTLKEVNSMKETFPIIYTALQILGTIPVTTCECERSNSALKR